MNNQELINLLKPFGKGLNDLTYDYSEFKTESLLDSEPCPDCGNEVDVMQNGKSDCPNCGHKEVLPCSLCPLNDLMICDWNEKTRCSAFPLNK